MEFKFKPIEWFPIHQNVIWSKYCAPFLLFSMSLFEKCVGLNENFRKPLDIGLIWEGNYWDDMDVHDCCDVDWETLNVLVRKIGKALLQENYPVDINERKNQEKILIFLPRLMQLPLTILAAHSVGYIGIIMDPLTTSVSLFENVILNEKPKFIVTVDSFWQAQQLIEVKTKIENVKGMEECQLLVIRHVAPNDGIPPPRKDFPAKRPFYKTSLELRDGKDLEWSTVMSEIKISEKDEKITKYEWEEEDVVMKIYDKHGILHTVQQQELIESLENRKMGLDTKMDGVENLMSLDDIGGLQTVVNLLIPWYIGKTLTLYEGPLDYPDSSRLSQIISKHSVNYILSSSTQDYSIPNPEYLKFFPTPTLKFSEIDLPF